MVGISDTMGKYVCIGMLFRSNNQKINSPLLPQLKNPRSLVRIPGPVSAFLETLLFCVLWFQPQAGFFSLSCYHPPLESARFLLPG